MGITNEMSEEVKKQGRQFLGEDTPIITKDKCFKYKGVNKQKKRKPGYSKCNVRASKNAEQAFLRSDIFTFAISRLSFFRLLLQLKALIR